jgi:DNA-binding transcriptional MocR family regulator
VWLELPDPWCTSDFVAAAEARKVAVAPADMFAVGRVQVPHAVRISLVALREDEEVIRALDVLSDLMHSTPQPRRASM